jgi:hypothetical protein
MSTKLHEILAVEADREAASTAIYDETIQTFTKRADHFQGKHTIYKPFAAGEPDSDEAVQELVTTVPAKLSHAFGVMAKSLDILATKDATNQVAKGQIMLNGIPIGPELPATTLLALESKLKRYIELLLAIPTLPPARKWELDPSKGEHIYLDAAPESRGRTKKVPMHKELSPATKEHPAQIEKWMEEIQIGRYVETRWSGMITPADKSALISKAQDLMAAIKQARQRANATEIVPVSIGEAIFAAILA